MRVSDGLPPAGSVAGDAAFEAARPRLWSLAYRMLGSVADAEDAVQSTWLRWRSAEQAAIASPEAWLVTACTRLCLDLRKAADRARVDYVGTWLPEPLPDGPASAGLLAAPAPSPAEQAELASSLTVAFLHLMERLSPAERAAYLLREVFDYDYARVAAVLGRSQPACRQLVARARRHLAEAQAQAQGQAQGQAQAQAQGQAQGQAQAQAQGQRQAQAGGPAGRARRGPLLESFFAALHSGDATRLEGLLAADVEMLSDSGGKVPAASRTVRGRRAVARFLLGIWRRHWRDQALEPARLNGADGLVLRDAAGVVGTLAFEPGPDGRWQRLYIQRNPDKLRHLQPR